MAEHTGLLVCKKDVFILIHHRETGVAHLQVGVLLLGFLKEFIPDIELQYIPFPDTVIPLRTLAVELDVFSPYVLLNQRFREQGNGFSHEAIQPLSGIVFLHNYFSHGPDYTL